MVDGGWWNKVAALKQSEGRGVPWLARYNTTMHPVVTQHIEIRANRDGEPRAFIAGTRIRVQDIYAHAELGGETPEQIVAIFPHLSLGQVHAALAYYFDHRDEVLAGMRQDEAFIEAVRNRSDRGSNDPIPPG